ncbi:MAG: hypothetical protein ABEK00_02215 [Candidatus Nanohaloarchaea archaeon]
MTEKKISPIERVVLEKESAKRGGMLVLIWGEQGSMKTMSMVRMVMFDMGIDQVGDEYNPEDVRRIPIWKAQESCQWILLAAQGLPITLWMHETVEDYGFKLTGSRKAGIDSRKLNLDALEGLDVQIKTFSEPEELVEKLEHDRVNAYFIPGSNGSEVEKYFYQKKNLDLCKALNSRDYGDHVTLNWDEVQNEAPDKRKGDFYELQMVDFPGEWEDFRKKRISLRGTGHSHNEVNYKLHKNKVTGTVYMRKAQVNSRHRSVDQKFVNSMEPGQFVVPGFEPGEFSMPQLPQKVFSWMPSHEDVRMEMQVEYDVPDVRPEKMEVKDWLDEMPFDRDDLDDLISLSEAVDLTSLGKTALKQRLYNGELNGVKVEGDYWMLSTHELLNHEDIPIET